MLGCYFKVLIAVFTSQLRVMRVPAFIITIDEMEAE